MSRLSILIPTIGRPELARILGELVSQLRPGDEICVVADGPQDLARRVAAGLGGAIRYFEHGPEHFWGHPQRNWVIPRATGDYLMSFDDDDRVAPGALSAVRKAIEERPGRPFLFRMHHEGDVLWKEPKVAEGNVSTQMFVTPNVPGRIGVWGSRYCGDFDFVDSTLRLYQEGHDAVVWREEIIAVHGTLAWKEAVDAWTW